MATLKKVELGVLVTLGSFGNTREAFDLHWRIFSFPPNFLNTQYESLSSLSVDIPFFGPSRAILMMQLEISFSALSFCVNNKLFKIWQRSSCLFFLWLEYKDDMTMIPKNSSVVVRRIPIGTKSKAQLAA